MTAPREFELKLELSPDDAASLAARGPGGRAGSARTRRLVSVYHDTADSKLRENGLTLRIREESGARVQTVKAAGETGVGLFDRGEWESPVAGDAPDPAAASGSPLARILGDGDVLAPVFRTEIERTTWIVDRRGGRIEVALDVGRVVAGDRSSPIVELELELKAGDPAGLFALAASLARRIPLRLAVAAKSDRGYALVDGPGPSYVKASRPPLREDMSAAEAFRAVARSAIRQFRLNEPLLDGPDPVEALHQARVALRRLRSAISLFRDVVADDRVATISDGLRLASGAMGEVRNLDVYIARVVAPEAARDDPPPGVAEYLDLLDVERRDRREKAAALLASAAFRRQMLELLAWVECGPWLTTSDPACAARRDEPVSTFAARILERRRRRVTKRGRHLRRLDPAARHEVRIAAKKLRYAADFVDALVTGKKTRRRYAAFLDPLEALQDELGRLNDIATGHDIAARFAGSGDVRDPDRAIALFAAGRVSGGEDERAAASLEAATRARKRVAKAKPFWTPPS